ncbi:hypothetical protein WJX74_005091 [Apatococcus lobatus]|uniref:CCDC113/CCDC96 coiled-coil domain-containing protein n=1 Tax=Apatococcus lobatus TaxID=904363 RepID=A0AAW1QJB5_9CHLO
METNRLDLRTPDTTPSTQEATAASTNVKDSHDVPSAASTSRPATEDTARQDGPTTSETLPEGSSTSRSLSSSRPPLSGSRFGTGTTNATRPSQSGSEPETTRSRLTSARRAAQIEGFEDDFADEVGPSEEDVSESSRRRLEELESAEEADLTERLKAAEERSKALKLQNIGVQQGLRQLLDARVKPREVEGHMTHLRSGLEARFSSALSSWRDLVQDQQTARSQGSTALSHAQMALDERKRQAHHVQQSLRKFLLDILRNAKQSKTGRPLPPKLVDAMEKAQDVKLEELQRVRQLNLFLRSRMSSLDERLKRKEEMAEGLHLIDFEQLKIENQSLAEKIEERNEELARLRGKTSQVMQILAHVKEKLHAVIRDNQVLQAKLDGHEQELNAKRVQLKSAKTAADRSLVQEQKLKESNPYVTAASLLDDLEKSRKQHGLLSTTVMELQTRHADTMARKELLSARLKEATAAASSQRWNGTRSGPGSPIYTSGSMPSPVLSHLSTSGSRAMSREAIFQMAPSTGSVRLVPAKPDVRFGRSGQLRRVSHRLTAKPAVPQDLAHILTYRSCSSDHGQTGFGAISDD